MKKEDKTAIIALLGEQLEQYSHFYITNIEGLNAEKTSALRRECFKQDVKLLVAKNTLLQKALEAKGIDEAIFAALKGNTALMLSNTGNAPAKLIKEFTKKEKNKEEAKPQLKAAYVEGCVYVGDNQLETLCNIKSREELIGDIVMLLQSPAKNVISALQSNAGQKIAGLVKALEERNN